MAITRFQRSVIGGLSILIVFFATCVNQHLTSFSEGEDVTATQKLPGDDQDNQKDIPQKEYKILAYEAVLPLVHASFSTLQCSFWELPPLVESFVEEHSVFHVPYISYFNTLFRLIIAPNAP